MNHQCLGWGVGHGKHPSSLFRCSGWEMMCQDSNKHCCQVWGWLSMTVAWSQLMAWLVVIACSAAAEVRQFPVARALASMLFYTLHEGSILVLPMYVFGQAEQGMRYTTPDLCSWAMVSITCTKALHRVWGGLNWF